MYAMTGEWLHESMEVTKTITPGRIPGFVHNHSL